MLSRVLSVMKDVGVIDFDQENLPRPPVITMLFPDFRCRSISGDGRQKVATTIRFSDGEDPILEAACSILLPLFHRYIETRNTMKHRNTIHRILAGPAFALTLFALRPPAAQAAIRSKRTIPTPLTSPQAGTPCPARPTSRSGIQQ